MPTTFRFTGAGIKECPRFRAILDGPGCSQRLLVLHIQEQWNAADQFEIGQRLPFVTARAAKDVIREHVHGNRAYRRWHFLRYGFKPRHHGPIRTH